MSTPKPESWVRVTPQGLYVEPGQFFIDPVRPVDRAVVTHGHADHARPGNAHVLATPGTLAIMKARYGDSVGATQALDYGNPIDVNAVLPDGTQFDGLAGLRKILLERKEQFTDAFTQRLLTYALGRGLEARDMPAVRTIARAAANDNYRIRTIILGIVRSDPFTLRRTPEP